MIQSEHAFLVAAFCSSDMDKEPYGFVVPWPPKCYKQHVPPQYIPDVYEGKETFCVVRDPYARTSWDLSREFGLRVADDTESFLACFLTTLKLLLSDMVFHRR